MKKTVQVTMEVDVEVDESKFTDQFHTEFRGAFYPFNDIDDHFKHLAQLCARGLYNFMPSDFIEGYGPAKDMGIKAESVVTDIEILPS